MKRTYYHKLIRDLVPSNMDRKGVKFRIRALNGQEIRQELLKKVGEEASSLPKLTTREDITDELADTLDVIQEIKRVFRISDRDIKRAQSAAFKKKGGFK